MPRWNQQNGRYEAEERDEKAELATLQRLLEEKFDRDWEDVLAREAGVIPEQIGSPASLANVVSARMQSREQSR